ncbi:TPA: hypothetical protein EYP70_06595, partial [Candidatus Bathyarchaeota archaeon]|nr:hypothetical protein [Candidatus Bathyarchaeota archaeon]
KALEIAKSVLVKRGNLFIKVFQGDLLGRLLTDIKIKFSLVRLFKPRASRPESAEIYILALGYLGNRQLKR